jgi:hypothetical protein
MGIYRFVILFVSLGTGDVFSVAHARAFSEGYNAPPILPFVNPHSVLTNSAIDFFLYLGFPRPGQFSPLPPRSTHPPAPLPPSLTTPPTHSWQTGLNFMPTPTTSSQLTKATWDSNTKTWRVKISREGQEAKVFEVKHLVCATGFGGGVPRTPDVFTCETGLRPRVELCVQETSRGWFVIRRGLRQGRNTLGRRRWLLGPALPVKFYVLLLADCLLTAR